MKIIILYVVLVGALLAGLLGILRVGDKLNAPVNVSGKWEINDAFVKDIGGSCTPITFHKKDPQLIIEQSGIFLKAKFNDDSRTEMTGKLENNKIVFSNIMRTIKNLSKSQENNINAELSLNVLQSDISPSKLSGEWQTPNCSTCGRIKFSAVRNQEE